MEVKKYSKVKMLGLYALSLFVNLLPLIIVLVFNWNACTKTRRESVALTVTGFIWVFFLIVTMIGNLPNKTNRVVTLTIVFLVLELMKPLLNYMCLFSGACALGSIADVIFIKKFAFVKVFHYICNGNYKK